MEEPLPSPRRCSQIGRASVRGGERRHSKQGLGDAELVTSKLEALSLGQLRLESALERIGRDVQDIAGQLRGAGSEKFLTAAYSNGGGDDPRRGSETEEREFDSHPAFQRVNSKDTLVSRFTAYSSAVSKAATSTGEFRPRRFDPAEGRESFMQVSHQLTSRDVPYLRLSHHRDSPYLLHQDSGVTVVLDVLVMLSMMIDTLIVPYCVAWQCPVRGFAWYASFSATTYWTLDMFVSFIRLPEESDERAPATLASVACRYLRTWFLWDLVLVICDWFVAVMEVLMGQGVSKLRVYRLMRVLRLTRLLRAGIRAGKMLHAEHMLLFDHKMGGFVGLAKMRIMARVSSLLLIGAITNHWGCCIWYAIANEGPSDTGNSWLKEHTYVDAGAFAQYVVSYHWAVAHMLGGEPIVHAQNSAETTFAIVALVIGVLYGSVLVSTIASVMIESHIASDSQIKKQADVQRFLISHKIDLGLSVQILMQMRQRLRHQAKPTLQDVPSLLSLSPCLLSELHHQLFARPILRSDILRLFSLVNKTLIRRISDHCTEIINVPEEAELFTPSKVAQTTYILSSGSIRYELAVDTSPPNESSSEAGGRVDVEPGSWLADRALWVEWKHRGWAEAASNCELLAVSVEQLGRALAASVEVSNLAVAFAAAVCRHLRATPAEGLTDLPLEQDVVFLMLPNEARSSLSLPVIELLQGQQQSVWYYGKRKGLKDLKAEIERNLCLLKVDSWGKFTRLVAIAVLELTNAKGQILVNVGELRNGVEPRFRCELPAQKVLAGECPEDALQRLLHTKLPLLGGGVAPTAREVQTKESDSASYGIHSKYVKTVFKASYDESAAQGGCCVLEPDIGSLSSLRARRKESSGSLSFTSKHLSMYASTRSDSASHYVGWDKAHSVPALVMALQGGDTSDSVEIYAWLSSADLAAARAQPNGVKAWLRELTLDNMHAFNPDDVVHI